MQKIQLYTCNIFWNINKNSAIWLARSTFDLIKEPDFSHACSLKRFIKAIMVHDLNLKNIHIKGLFLFLQNSYTLPPLPPKKRVPLLAYKHTFRSKY